MTDLSHVDDDEFDEFEVDDGEGDEGGGADAHEGDGDEGDDEGGQDDEGEGGQEPLEPRDSRRRASNSIRGLKAELKEAKARIARVDTLEQELAALKAQRHAPAPSQADIERYEREEAERIDMMSPAEAARYVRQQMRAEMQQELQRDRIQQRDNSDRSSFESLTGRNPVAARYADKVEKLVKERRAAGEYVPREVALKFLIGEDALNKGTGKQASQQRRAAANRITDATTRGTRPSGGQPSERGVRRGGAESLEELERRIGDTVF